MSSTSFDPSIAPPLWPTAVALALLAPAAAWAQSAEAPRAQRVEVRGDGQAQRRADPAGRLVVGRDELLRHGDSRLVDALQRLPGITVEVRGSAVELKLGGLGTGYTQILLNGEPLPRGVALDSIALDGLERVEVLRGASVDTAQAIAGSINLVTRRPTELATREYRLQAASQWGRAQATAGFELGDQMGRATWGLGVSTSREDQQWPATVFQQRFEGDPSRLTQQVRTDKCEYDRTDAISLNPRLSWKQPAADGRSLQFSTDHSLRYAVSRGGVDDQRTPLLGPPPAQQAGRLVLNYRRLFWRGRLQAVHRDADGAQTEVRLNLTHSSRDQQSRAEGWDFRPQLVQDSAVEGHAMDQSAVLYLNHQRPLGESHRLNLGVESEQARRREDRVQTEQDLPGGLPPQNLDERYDARVGRRALYLQDDWTLSAASAVQWGLRLERLDTRTEGNVFDGVRQAHHLAGPVLRLSTRPGEGPGVLKLGLSRGFKLPAPRDVMPRRYVPIEVSPTAPAMSGNPELRPERAWSLDASWQDKAGVWRGDWVLSAALRRIDDVILDRLLSQPDVPSAPWLLQRFNGGRAWSAGLELEMKGEAAHQHLAGAPLRWQLSLALARSRLADVAGAHPALPGQARWQLKLDLTQVLKPGWTGQIGLQARGRSRADLPSDRSLENLAAHSWNASLSWQPQPHRTRRWSVTQLGATDAVDLKSVRLTEGGQPVDYRAREAWHRGAVWRLGLDSRF